jgi:AraC-like DNA-binding protein
VFQKKIKSGHYQNFLCCAWFCRNIYSFVKMIKDNHKKSKEKAQGPAIETYHFLPRKYGRELLLDIGRIESLKNFIVDDTPHNISFYEILFIEKGNGSFALDENKMPIEPGAVIFTSPGQVRRWNVKRPVSGYTLFFEKDFLNLFFTDDLFLYRFQFFHQYASPTNMKMPSTIFWETLKLVNGIEKEYNQLQNDSGHLLRAILYQLLVILNRHYAATHHLQSDTYIHPDFFRFRSLLEKEFIMHHYVATYAQLLKISTNHLNKICRQYSGHSAQEMIHKKLISEIKRQLRSNKSIKEIVYEYEFSDPSNFNRFFKKLTGATAQQYRDNL